MAKADSLRTIFYALGANFAIFLAKLGAAIVTHSGAMAAEAVHSLADCANQILLLIGMRSAKAPPTPEHPLGHGKAVYFWSFLVSLMLFCVGGTYSLYEGVHKLNHPEPLRQAWVAIAVLVFGVIAESLSMWGCLHEVNKVRGRRTFLRWFRESRQSELIVIFGEDLAALLGLVFALVAVLLTMLTGNATFDAFGTLAIGVLLVVIAVFIAVEVKALLIGQSIDPGLQDEIRAFLDQRPEVVRVFNLITLQLGPDVMVSIKAEMRRDTTALGLIEAINAVEHDMKVRFPEIRWSFFEPDVTD